MVSGRSDQLGSCFLRILASSAGESHWVYSSESWPTDDRAEVITLVVFILFVMLIMK